MSEDHFVASAVQRQTALAAFFPSKQLLLFDFVMRKDKKPQFLTWKVSSYCCLTLRGSTDGDT